MTIGKETHPVPAPFLVMATQNPIESEGTYPLPEAQVDRFMLKVARRLPVPGRRADGDRAGARRSPSPSSSCFRSRISPTSSARPTQVYVDPAVSRYALAHRDRDAASSASVGPRRARAVRRVRREPARPDQPRPRRPRARAAARPALRAAAGRARARQGRAAPPDGAQLRGARRGRRRRPVLDRVLEAVPMPQLDLARGGRRVSRRRTPLGPARTPARPGPGPLPGGAAPQGRPHRAPAHRRAARRRPPLVGLRRRHRARAGPPLRARRRRPPDRLERHGADGRAARPRARRRARGRDVAPARHVRLDDLRHRRPAQVGRRRRRRARGRPRRGAARQPARPSRRSATGARRLAATAGRPRPAAAAARAAARARPRAGRADVARDRARDGSGGSSRRRSVVVVVSDFRGPRDWRPPLLRLAARHDVARGRDPRPARAGAARRRRPLARRPRDRAAAPGRHAQPQAARALRAEAAAERDELARELRSLGVAHVVLSTSGDWLRPLVGFLQVERRRR